MSEPSPPPPFSAPYAPNDRLIAARLLEAPRPDAGQEQRIDDTATRLIEAIRANDDPLGGVEDMLREFALSTKEGLALMVLAERRFGCVGIIDGEGGLIGIITDGDLARHMDSPNLLDRKAREVMTRKPKIAAPRQLAAEALAFMNANKITRLFVLDPEDAGRKPLGILHIHDCLRAGLE